MADFRKLHVWQRAHTFNIRVAEVVAGMRDASFASLRSQMARAAHSIPSNIVEGRGQKTDAQFARYIRIALNSASELEYHLLTAHALAAIDDETFVPLVAELKEIRQMLHGLLRMLEKSA